ncbi:uncharacterized protein B4U80_11514 [Leptotrombidium deliense]|uniref:Peptidase S1 domain-containing protein n=1 Tax=Leptotrombidium deliense TaxID=299467 RepID=A0A443SFM9_9ACAR|nr:uncharacterized protein B4U80_11514 [Leptotrombidium deliense]
MVRVVLGVNNLQGSWSLSRQLSNIIVHPLYTGPPNQVNDIALLKLRQNIGINSRISPICLPNMTMTRFSNLYATGWGSASEQGSGTQNLMVVGLQERDSYCHRLYNAAVFNSKHICANANGGDVCNGDSGGPLITYANGAAYSVGLVSWGIICGAYKYPSVFTRVTSFRDWIVSNSNLDANWCRYP